MINLKLLKNVNTGANTTDFNSVLSSARDGSKSRRSRAERNAIAERSKSNSLEKHYTKPLIEELEH